MTIAGGEVFAGAPDTTFTPRAQGAVFAYASPSSGWSGTVGESAVLDASHPADGDGVGTGVESDGQTVVTGSNAGALYVFVQPSGGWTGVVHESAILTASDGAMLLNPVLSGSTIVARGANPATHASSIYVFSEPTGGWSGTLHQTAKLTASDIGPSMNSPNFGSDVAISGNVIFAALPDTAPHPAEYVFTEPTGGWGDETQTAKLVASNGQLLAGAGFAAGTFSVAGGTIAVPGAENVTPTSTRPAIFVYTAPAAGWSGTVTESATLVSSDGGPLYSPTLSGSAIVAGPVRAATSQDVIADDPAYVFVEPSGGWSGRLTETAKLTAASPGLSRKLDLFAEPAAGWSSESPSATLVPPGDPTQVIFDDVAASGQTAAASGAGDAFVYTTPAAGWPNVGQSAQLTDSGGQALGDVEVSAGTVTALAKSGADTGDRVDVFTQPAAGWTGSVSETATLTPSDGAPLYAVAVDGSTVVALGGSGPNSAMAYVFTEPAGGWGGNQHEVAKLHIPGWPYPGGVSVQGATVVVFGTISGTTVLATGTAYVFTEPPSGWSGTRSPSALIVPPRWEARYTDVYTKPAGGWTGTVRPAARLLATGPAMAISGSTVAVTEVQYPTSRYDSCPCAGHLVLFTEPKRGWSGVLTAQPVLGGETDYTGAMPVALDRNAVFVGAQPLSQRDEPALDAFDITGPISESPVTPGHPRSRVNLTGLRHGRPRLMLSLQAGAYAPPIASFSLALPAGLRFSRHLMRTLVRLGPGIAVHLRRGRLVVTITYWSEAFTLKIGPRSLIESGWLRARVRHRRRLRLRFTVRVIDAAGATTRLTASLLVG